MLDDMSAMWFTVDDDGEIRYTKIGLESYRSLFQSVGINIEDVRTEKEHSQAVAKATKASASRK